MRVYMPREFSLTVLWLQRKHILVVITYDHGYKLASLENPHEATFETHPLPCPQLPTPRLAGGM
jgi:hypothetical protein